MKVVTIVKNYINRGGKPREIGRYFSSELYNIIKGDITPKNFFEKKEIDELGCKYCSEGIAIEDYLTKVFKEMNVDVECQAYKEIEITPEIKLSAKPDYNFGAFLVELKRPSRIQEEIPIWYAYQLESYYRAFYLPIYLWQVSYPLTIKELAYTPSNVRWRKIKRTLIEFDEELKKVGSN